MAPRQDSGKLAHQRLISRAISTPHPSAPHQLFGTARRSGREGCWKNI
jgi:hypothetical protein